MVDGRRWVLGLPEQLVAQRALLIRLLDAAEADQRWRFLEVSCSLVRGNADRWSDVDAGLGAATDDWSATVAAADALVRHLGHVVDVLHDDLGWTQQHRWLFVQYADEVQLDLTIVRANERGGLPPGAVALLDRDGDLSVASTPAALTTSAADRAAWEFQGWIAVSNIVKYLSRNSLWEALAQLDRARDMVWRLWAADHGLDYARFGLTTVLDAPSVGAPPAIEQAVAGLDREQIRAAAGQVARLLDAVPARAHPQMAGFTLARLRALG